VIVTDWPIVYVKHPAPQLVPTGLGVAVPAPPALVAVAIVRVKVGSITPQIVPLHVAVPEAGVAQAVHEVPHVAMLVFEAHTPPQG